MSKWLRFTVKSHPQFCQGESPFDSAGASLRVLSERNESKDRLCPERSDGYGYALSDARSAESKGSTPASRIILNKPLNTEKILKSIALSFEYVLN